MGGIFFGRLRAFAGSPLLPGAGPAGLRWLLKSPPRHAGQAPAPLRAAWLNPYRRPLKKNVLLCICS